ncbi:SBBP repeat-containing protein [bacterium]|nr:SBBP repeat-containing protein [bacterium]
MGRWVIITALIAGTLVAGTAGFASAAADWQKGFEIAGVSDMFMLASTTNLGAGERDALLSYMNAADLSGWVRTWGTSINEWPEALAVDPSGNAIIVGSYDRTQSGDYVATPGWIIKVDKSGNLLWAKQIGWTTWSIIPYAVTTDDFGNIYVTGQLWNYHEVYDPAGFFPVLGFVYTAKLTAAGEFVWGKRWRADEYDFLAGEAILCNGSEVVVVGTYDNNITHETDTLVIWYNAADGTTIDAVHWGLPDQYATPTAADYSPSGEVYICGWTAPENDVLLLKFSAGRNLLEVQAWGSGGNEFANDIDVIGDEVMLVGQVENGKHPPVGDDSYQAPKWDGLFLHFENDVLVGQQLCRNLAANTDGAFHNVAARNAFEVWVTSTGYERNNYTYEQVKGANTYLSTSLEKAVPREDDNTPSSVSDVSASFLTPMSLGDFAVYMGQQPAELSMLEWSTQPHTPDPQLTADVTTGPAELTVNFDASASTIDFGTIAGFAWDPDLGDGQSFADTGLTSTWQHVYTQPGDYLAAVQVRSDDGTKIIKTLKIKVTAAQ